MATLRQDLANEIRRIRNNLGMTLKEFGAKIGASEATVSRWEAAKHVPETQYLERIARLQHKTGGGEPGFLGKYLDLRNRERTAAALEGLKGVVEVGKPYRIGPHTVQLTQTGALVVNGLVRIEPEAAK